MFEIGDIVYVIKNDELFKTKEHQNGVILEKKKVMMDYGVFENYYMICFGEVTLRDVHESEIFKNMKYAEKSMSIS